MTPEQQAETIALLPTASDALLTELGLLSAERLTLHASRSTLADVRAVIAATELRRAIAFEQIRRLQNPGPNGTHDALEIRCMTSARALDEVATGPPFGAFEPPRQRQVCEM